MFDIGFTELVMVGIVALIVVGPEKLPGLARTSLSYIRKFKSSFHQIRDEVERELELDELKQQIDDAKSDVTEASGYDDLQASLDELQKESEELRDIAEEGYEHDDFFTDEMGQTDDADSEHNLASSLPKPDSEADTGIETDQPIQHADKTPKKSTSNDSSIN